jgi:hypothetical protein
LSVPYRLGTLTYKLQVKTRGRTCIPAPSRILQHRTKPPCLGELRHCRVSNGSGLHLPICEISDAATHPAASYITGCGLQCHRVSHGSEPHLSAREGSNADMHPMALCGSWTVNKEMLSYNGHAARLAHYRDVYKTCGQTTLS